MDKTIATFDGRTYMPGGVGTFVAVNTNGLLAELRYAPCPSSSDSTARACLIGFALRVGVVGQATTIAAVLMPRITPRAGAALHGGVIVFRNGEPIPLSYNSGQLAWETLSAGMRVAVDSTRILADGTNSTIVTVTTERGDSVRGVFSTTSAVVTIIVGAASRGKERVKNVRSGPNTGLCGLRSGCPTRDLRRPTTCGGTVPTADSLLTIPFYPINAVRMVEAARVHEPASLFPTIVTHMYASHPATVFLTRELNPVLEPAPFTTPAFAAGDSACVNVPVGALREVCNALQADHQELLVDAAHAICEYSCPVDSRTDSAYNLGASIAPWLVPQAWCAARVCLDQWAVLSRRGALEPSLRRVATRSFSQGDSHPYRPFVRPPEWLRPWYEAGDAGGGSGHQTGFQAFRDHRWVADPLFWDYANDRNILPPADIVAGPLHARAWFLPWHGFGGTYSFRLDPDAPLGITPNAGTRAGNVRRTRVTHNVTIECTQYPWEVAVSVPAPARVPLTRVGSAAVGTLFPQVTLRAAFTQLDARIARNVRVAWTIWPNMGVRVLYFESLRPVFVFNPAAARAGVYNVSMAVTDGCRILRPANVSLELACPVSGRPCYVTAVSTQRQQFATAWDGQVVASNPMALAVFTPGQRISGPAATGGAFGPAIVQRVLGGPQLASSDLAAGSTPAFTTTWVVVGGESAGGGVWTITRTAEATTTSNASWEQLPRAAPTKTDERWAVFARLESLRSFRLTEAERVVTTTATTFRFRRTLVRRKVRRCAVALATPAQECESSVDCRRVFVYARDTGMTDAECEGLYTLTNTFGTECSSQTDNITVRAVCQALPTVRTLYPTRVPYAYRSFDTEDQPEFRVRLDDQDDLLYRSRPSGPAGSTAAEVRSVRLQTDVTWGHTWLASVNGDLGGWSCDATTQALRSLINTPNQEQLLGMCNVINVKMPSFKTFATVLTARARTDGELVPASLGGNYRLRIARSNGCREEVVWANFTYVCHDTLTARIVPPVSPAPGSVAGTGEQETITFPALDPLTTITATTREFRVELTSSAEPTSFAAQRAYFQWTAFERPDGFPADERAMQELDKGQGVTREFRVGDSEFLLPPRGTAASEPSWLPPVSVALQPQAPTALDKREIVATVEILPDNANYVIPGTYTLTAYLTDGCRMLTRTAKFTISQPTRVAADVALDVTAGGGAAATSEWDRAFLSTTTNNAPEAKLGWRRWLVRSTPIANDNNPPRRFTWTGRGPQESAGSGTATASTTFAMQATSAAGAINYTVVFRNRARWNQAAGTLTATCPTSNTWPNAISVTMAAESAGWIFQKRTPTFDYYADFIAKQTSAPDYHTSTTAVIDAQWSFTVTEAPCDRRAAMNAQTFYTSKYGPSAHSSGRRWAGTTSTANLYREVAGGMTAASLVRGGSYKIELWFNDYCPGSTLQPKLGATYTITLPCPTSTTSKAHNAEGIVVLPSSITAVVDAQNALPGLLPAFAEIGNLGDRATARYPSTGSEWLVTWTVDAAPRSSAYEPRNWRRATVDQGSCQYAQVGGNLASSNATHDEYNEECTFTTRDFESRVHLSNGNRPDVWVANSTFNDQVNGARTFGARVELAQAAAPANLVANVRLPAMWTASDGLQVLVSSVFAAQTRGGRLAARVLCRGLRLGGENPTVQFDVGTASATHGWCIGIDPSLGAGATAGCTGLEETILDCPNVRLGRLGSATCGNANTGVRVQCADSTAVTSEQAFQLWRRDVSGVMFHPDLEGAYKLRLSVDDRCSCVQEVVSSDFTVSACPTWDLTASAQDASATLTLAGSADRSIVSCVTGNYVATVSGRPYNSPMYNWSVTSAGIPTDPAVVSIYDATDNPIKACFYEPGTYLLRVTGTDGCSSRSHQVEVTVRPGETQDRTTTVLYTAAGLALADEASVPLVPQPDTWAEEAWAYETRVRDGAPRLSWTLVAYNPTRTGPTATAGRSLPDEDGVSGRAEPRAVPDYSNPTWAESLEAKVGLSVGFGILGAALLVMAAFFITKFAIAGGACPRAAGAAGERASPNAVIPVGNPLV